MLKNQEKFLNYLTKVEGELQKCDFADKFKFNSIKEVIRDTELLVPVIGAFSAGKSSLLNSFLQNKYLPEGITPETALATELRYSEEEYIEAVKDDADVEKFSIDDIEEITKKAHKYKYLKMYINKTQLKTIQPLILVDMPGFESPLDLHNKAIMEYISKGVHYVVLTSVEDGTITRSMVRQLTDIQEYGRDFSFFLSKTNLRAESEAKEVAQNLQEQIEDYFDTKKDIVLIDNDGGESLKKILQSIDPEELFKELFLDELKENYFSIIELLNITISSLGKNKEENKKLIDELKSSLLKVQKERDKMIEEAYEKYSDKNVKQIVESVTKELSNSIDELATTAINQGQEAMLALIAEILRSALIPHIKESVTDISHEIVDDFSKTLTDLNDSMSEMTMSDDWLSKIVDRTKDLLSDTKINLTDIVENRKKSDNNDKLYKIVTTILATTTTVLNPILELVIIFLPDILGGFFENYKKQKQKEKIVENLQMSVIPKIKRELRTKLPDIFNKQIKELIKNISGQFEHIIDDKKSAIEATQKEIDEKNIDIQKQINLYQEISKNITTLANTTLYL